MEVKVCSHLKPVSASVFLQLRGAGAGVLSPTLLNFRLSPLPAGFSDSLRPGLSHQAGAEAQTGDRNVRTTNWKIIQMALNVTI